MTPAPSATWRAAWRHATEVLGDEREARWLVEEVASFDATNFALRLDDEVDGRSSARLAGLVERRRAGEPLQHVLGHWPFRTLELTVDARALVPRPETEIVAGHALGLIAERRAARARRGGPMTACQVVDLGTGSGAIACALVVEDEHVHVVAVDASPDALALAALNRAALPPDAAARLELAQGSWFDALPSHVVGSVDCIVSNPPYLAVSEWTALDPVVRDHDPYSALVSGPSGLEAIDEIIAGAPHVLAPGGGIVVEIAPAQAAAARASARRAGACQIEIAPDLAGRARVLLARWPERTVSAGERR